MIKNIKINNFGPYKNYFNNSIVFGAFNLLLGWNYSGKTTLSRIFACFDNKKLPINYDVIDFELYDDSLPAKKITQNNLSELKTKVFNIDYIKNNLIYEQQNATNIIVLTDNATNILKKLSDLESQIRNLNSQVYNYKTQLQGSERKINQLYTNSAREIAEKLLIVRTFNANDLKRIIDNISIDNLQKNIIDNNELEQIIKTHANNEDKNISVQIPTIPIISTEEINKILKETISISDPIERLKSDKLKEKWVSEGLKLHENENCCIFCGRPLTENIKKELNNYFSEAYKLFGERIIELQKNL